MIHIQRTSVKKWRGLSFLIVLFILLKVGPGEVDDELEDEVGSECAKYGTVTRVLIFEITEPNFPVDEAVRIFVQFERSEETTKALVDLDGRFFGGRVVHATFYDEDRFSKNELAPMPGEIPGFTWKIGQQVWNARRSFPDVWCSKSRLWLKDFCSVVSSNQSWSKLLFFSWAVWSNDDACNITMNCIYVNNLWLHFDKLQSI